MSLWSRIANVFLSSHLHSELDEELESHVEEAIAHGRDESEVRRVLGSPLRHREASRDVKLLPWLDSLRADAIFGWRQLNKHKVTSAAAILSLALAIGACMSAFRLIDALLLRPLPIANPERLHIVAFRGNGPDGKPMTWEASSYPMFRQMRAELREQAEFVAVSYADRLDLTYSSDQEMEKEYVQFVSGWTFSSFGIRPALGRVFVEDDDSKPGAHPYAVLSHDYWTRRFGRDPNVIGLTFRIADTIYQIVGIAEPPFTGTETGTVTAIFLPMAMKNPHTLASPDHFWLRSFVLLKPGVAPEPVQEKLRSIFRAIQLDRIKAMVAVPQSQIDKELQQTLILDSAASGRSDLQRDYKTALLVLGLLVALVLLIACANVANLMTAHAAARAREMALRVSIGAGGSRLVQLVLVESAMRAFLAALLGGLMAWWSAPFIVSKINPPDNPARLLLPADWRVFGFGILLSLAVTLLFGLFPALRASAVRPVSALKGGEDPQSRRRLMHILISGQVAFCFVVLFVAGLFVATFDHLTHQPTGFSSLGILDLETFTKSPQSPVYWEQVVGHLRAVPGVESVAVIGWPLMSGESAIGFLSIHGAPTSDVFCDFLAISPGLLGTMQIPLLDGNDFRLEDTNPPAAIVNQAFANQYFNGENPVGKTFEKVEGPNDRVSYRIVGFIRDARTRDNLRIPIRPTAFVPFRSMDTLGVLQPQGRGTFVVRVSGAAPLALPSVLRQEVSGARPEFRVSNIRTQTEINQARTIRERLLASLALFFAAVALLLAGVGLYGVLHYSVLQRRREIGIRIAIGARPGIVARLVTVEVFTMILVGAAAGVALGLASMRYLESLFYQVKPTDLPILAVPSLATIATALLAAVPAVLRAIHIDPATLLCTD